MLISLLDLTFGEKAVVREITGDISSRNRLMELGLIPGSEIIAKNQAPFAGPTIYKINTMQIGIDRNIASNVQVEVNRIGN